MRKLHWLFMVVCLAVMPALQSCDDNDGYSIGDFTPPLWATVRVTGNAFYLDCDVWGTLWPVNTDLGWYEPVDGKRVITIFNPLSDGFDGYDHAVKLLRLYDVLTKEVETLTPETEEEFGNDPVAIFKGDIGISGGYLNIVFQQNLPSEKKHRISLVQPAEATADAVSEDDGYLHLELRYNNYGDVSGRRAAGLVSFNLKEVLTPEMKGIKLKLNSEVNKEVEIVFEKQSNNAEEASNLDFSKMQLK